MKNIKTMDKSLLHNRDIYITKKQGDTSFYLHRHDYYEIIFYHHCYGACTLNGVKYEINDNGLFLLTPGDYHKIDARNSDQSSAINISFSNSVIEKNLITELSFAPRIWRGLPEESIGLLEGIYSIFRKSGTAPTQFAQKTVLFLLNAIVSDILNGGEKIEPEKSCVRPMIRQVMTYIHANLSKNISLCEVAESCGMNVTYFSELFHKETGSSFKKWLTSIRIEYAKRLMEEQDVPILDIAYECGYNTPSQFYKMFKKEVGITPSKYKKSIQNER